MSREACIVVSAPSPPFSRYKEGASKCAFYRDEATFRVNGLTPPCIKFGGSNSNSPVAFFANTKSLGVVKSWEAIGLESANSKVSLDEQITTFRAKICYCGWLEPVKSPQSKLLFAIIHDIELRTQGNWLDTKPFFNPEARNSCIKLDVRSRVIRYGVGIDEGVNSIPYTNEY